MGYSVVVVHSALAEARMARMLAANFIVETWNVQKDGSDEIMRRSERGLLL